MKNKDLVSIVMPAYNSARFISESINSVLLQTYINWELIIIDDGSTDETCKIVAEYMKSDSRIKLLHNESSIHGAAEARNCGIRVAQGRYLAYLDSDDLWMKDKLYKQIEYMQKNGYVFSCVSYEVIDEWGDFKGRTVHMLNEVDTKKFLMNNLLQTVGIMIDMEYVRKPLVYMPNYPRTEDAASWIKIMNNGNKCYGMDIVLAQYRRRKSSLSSNKFSGLRWMWNLYRVEANCTIRDSLYYFVRYAILAIWKRIPSERKSSVNYN